VSPSSRPTTNTTGNSSPFAACMVSSDTHQRARPRNPLPWRAQPARATAPHLRCRRALSDSNSAPKILSRNLSRWEGSAPAAAMIRSIAAASSLGPVGLGNITIQPQGGREERRSTTSTSSAIKKIAPARGRLCPRTCHEIAASAHPQPAFARYATTNRGVFFVSI
jgi:hypothetical protein